MHLPAIKKSTRHSKLTGNFAESLVLYWLSKHGFECALVDHTGIDIIASCAALGDRLGISVKSRSRVAGTESTTVNIDLEHIDKCRKACAAFGCEPYYAIVVDANGVIEGYIVSEPVLLEYAPPGRSKISWKMSKDWKTRYAADSRVVAFRMECSVINWWIDEK